MTYWATDPMYTPFSKMARMMTGIKNSIEASSDWKERRFGDEPEATERDVYPEGGGKLTWATNPIVGTDPPRLTACTDLFSVPAPPT